MVVELVVDNVDITLVWGIVDDVDHAVRISGSFHLTIANFNTSVRVTATVVRRIKDMTIILAER